jgi:nucleoside-diphosphate-sugar epimerase
MRVVVIGGTRFIGRALVSELLGAGHEVAVVHRGIHEDLGGGQVEHIHTDRRDLAARRRELVRFRPDAMIDMSAMTRSDAATAGSVFDDSVRLAVASSIDVYRAYSAVATGTVSDAVPLSEEAPLRDQAPPDAGEVPPGWNFDPAQYEKLDVERVYLERGAVVCRLPMVYGEHDYKRREEFVLRRVRARRERIPIGAGNFLWSRGYAPEIARALRLAIERRDEGEIFNLAESVCGTIRLWVEEVLSASGHEAELVRVPDERLPDDLDLTAAIAQHWLVDATKARERLGWVHAPGGNAFTDRFAGISTIRHRPPTRSSAPTRRRCGPPHPPNGCRARECGSVPHHGRHAADVRAEPQRPRSWRGVTLGMGRHTLGGDAETVRGGRCHSPTSAKKTGVYFFRCN